MAGGKGRASKAAAAAATGVARRRSARLGPADETARRTTRRSQNAASEAAADRSAGCEAPRKRIKLEPSTTKAREIDGNQAGRSCSSEATWSADAVRFERLRNQGLVDRSARPDCPLAVARNFVGIQAQEPESAFISLWSRTNGIALADCHALVGARNLVRIWGPRGTLHLHAVDVWPDVVSACSDVLDKLHDTVRKDGLWDALVQDAESAVARLRAAAPGSEIPISELASQKRLERSLMGFLCSAGVASRPELRPSRRAMVVSHGDREWAPSAQAEALERAALRYLRTYGPASERDFRYYCGLPAGPSRSAMQRLADQGLVLPLKVDRGANSLTGADLAVNEEHDPSESLVGEELLYCAEKLARGPPQVPGPGLSAWPVRFLSRFDPILLGHMNKSTLLCPKERTAVWTKNLLIPATVLAGGRLCGLWERRVETASGQKGLVVEIKPLPGGSAIWLLALPETRAGVAEEASSLARFLLGEDAGFRVVWDQVNAAVAARKVAASE